MRIGLLREDEEIFLEVVNSANWLKQGKKTESWRVRVIGKIKLFKVIRLDVLALGSRRQRKH